MLNCVFPIAALQSTSGTKATREETSNAETYKKYLGMKLDACNKIIFSYHSLSEIIRIKSRQGKGKKRE